VALVPLNFKGNIAGLLQFNDRRKDRFTSEKIALFERLAKSIAIALAQRSAEENLKKSEERYRRLAEAAHDLIFVVDPEYKLTYVNSFAAKLFNLKQGDIIGRNMNEFFHPPTSERQRKNVEKVFQTNEPLYVEAESRLSLTTIWLGTWLVPIRDQGGQAKEVMGISRDITQRRRMEEELQHIFNLIPDMLCTASIDGYFKQLNPSWEKTLGFPLDELLSKSFAEFIHPDDLGPTLKEVEKQITGQSTINFNNRYLCKNGTYKWFEWNAIPSPDGELLYAVARDITKRKEMEDSLHETQKLLQAIASYTPDHIIVQDNQLRYLYVANPQLDLTEKEMIGKMDYDFLQPEEAARLTQVKKEVLRTGKAVHFETSLVSKAGGEEFFDGTFVPRFDSFGQADGLIGYFRNVTETKKVYDQLLASLKEKEVLLQEIHHRVKNNLQVISSLLNLQGHRLKDKEQQAVFQDSQNRIKSMALVHEQLYQSPDLSRVDFPEYLRKLTAMLFRTYERASSTIRLQITARGIFLQAAKAVPCGLIVNELVTNALKHAFPHNRSGTISIEVVPKGNQFRLTVQDNGVGLPETLDPLRSESLGLQIVQVLVKQLDGKLEFDRQRGTRFILRFSKEDKPSGSRTIFK
jgi:PAS domain S-box-containing protein